MTRKRSLASRSISKYSLKSLIAALICFGYGTLAPGLELTLNFSD